MPKGRQLELTIEICSLASYEVGSDGCEIAYRVVEKGRPRGRDPNGVSVREAAERLGISRGSAYSLARMGELPGAFQLGHRWLVSLIKLPRAVHGSEDGGTQEPG